MQRLLAGIAVLLLGMLVLPAFADDKDKKDPTPDAKKDADKKDPAPDPKKDPDKKDETVNTEKTIKAGTVVGKVVEVNGTKKSIRVQVAYEIPKLNVGEVQGMQNDQAQLAQAMYKRPPDYNQIANLQVSIAQHKARMYTSERKTQDVEVMSADDVKVRMTTPPVAYDDKGNVKKYTSKELKELKGDPKDPDSKLPGYPGDFSNLRNDQVVKVSLIKKKDAPKPTGPKPKDADADLLGDNEPQASIIEILADAPAK